MTLFETPLLSFRFLAGPLNLAALYNVRFREAPQSEIDAVRVWSAVVQAPLIQSLRGISHFCFFLQKLKKTDFEFKK